jgi:hypothetical protein
VLGAVVLSGRGRVGKMLMIGGRVMFSYGLFKPIGEFGKAVIRTPCASGNGVAVQT